MKLKKLTKLITSVTVLTSMFGSTFASAATISSQSSDSTSASESDENVLKVKMDDAGELSYSVPKSGSYGDVTYDENRTFSWDNASVYFVVTDRFVNGDTSNDHSYGRGLDKSGNEIANYQNKEGYFHGGDLKGLTSKIEDGYFDNLGVNAIWLTAPYEQIHGALSAGGFKHYAYHGYYALDYTEVDENMGTAQDLENFIDTAHEHGIRVIFDIVMNHAGYANPKDADEFGYGKLASNWKEIYYDWSESQYKWYNDYVAEASQNGSQGMMDAQNGDWETNWWGSKWVRMTQGRFTAYANQAPEAAGVETCVDGLPDFVTEGTTDPGMPSILKKKWSSAKLAQEEQELNEFCQNYGMQKCVTTYLVKWLTDWVREYGVDGFRCDTAKHINVTEWGKLKKAGVQALKEWRQNNPNKPGAKWTDDFWMTGEHWDHGVGKDSYYTTGGFDSMINFSFQGNENKTGSALEGTYSSYARQINSDPTFNVLSYISSHDTALGARSANAGTALLLTPGGVQIYYGDESGRQGDGTSDKQPTRSNMNWNSMNNSILSNWQKVGQFRSNHLAVGAGSHTQISASPYTFSRVYSKNGVEDKVVISLPGKSGPCTVSVGDTFNDGDGVRDYYTGEEYVVSGGSVAVTAGENGVVLLESTGVSKPSVGANPGSKKIYKAETVTLSASKGVTGYYSIDGGAKTKFSNGDTITVGEGLSIGESTTLEVSGTSSEGTVDTKTYTYTMAEKPKNDIVIKAKSSKWTSAPNIYVYENSTAETTIGPAWPGTAMTKEGDWYVYRYEPGEAAGDDYSVRVIFNGTWGQEPGAQQPGYVVKGSMEYNNGVWSESSDDEQEGTVIVKYVDEDGNQIASQTTKTGTVGTSYTTTAKTISGYTLKTTPSNANGTYKNGTITVTYVYSKNGDVSEGTVIVKHVDEYTNKVLKTETLTGEVGETYTTSEASISGYILTLIPTNATGKFTSGTITVTYYYESDGSDSEELTINSLVTHKASPQNVGTSIILTADAKGTGVLQYRFRVKNASGVTTTIQDYTTSNETVWYANSVGTNTLYVDVKDGNGNVKTKSINYTIKSNLAISSFTANKTSPQAVKT
ncbi:MAG: MucBP domain-containing protein, partial [Clostridium sp.]